MSMLGRFITPDKIIVYAPIFILKSKSIVFYIAIDNIVYLFKCTVFANNNNARIITLIIIIIIIIIIKAFGK